MNHAVQFKILDSGVALITLDLHDSKVNVLSRVAMTELNQVLDELKVTADKTLKGVVIHSGKPDNFIAGADVKEIQAIQNENSIRAYEASKLGKEVFAKFKNLGVPVVAAIHGLCLGGGTELTLWCTYRIASNDPKTKIGLPEVMLGLVPGWGATAILPRLVGIQSALELITAGRAIDARKAWRLGLVDETTSEVDLIQRAEQIALTGKVSRCQPSLKKKLMAGLLETNPIGREIIASQALSMIMRETKGKYPAPTSALDLVLYAPTRRLEEALEEESRQFAHLALTKESRNLVGIWKAETDSKRVLDNIGPVIKVKRVAVLGAGVMGAGIAQSLAYAGFEVVLKDIHLDGKADNEQPLARGMETIRSLFNTLVEKRRLSASEAELMASSVKATTDYKDLSGCELVIEAVLEVMNIKKSVLAECEKAITNPFIFATNTSSLSVSELSQAAQNPANVAGFHFFNPVHKMLLVELVRGTSTSDETLAAVRAVALKLGKKVVTTDDSTGFIVNRILAPYLREAIVLMEQGVPPEEIEKAMTSFGMPMGPLALLDEVGLDIAEHVIKTMHAKLGDRLAPPGLLSLVDGEKLYGKKGGRGIYLYDEKDKRSGFNPDVLSAVTAKAHPKQKGEIEKRLVLVMINEAARCMEENIVTDPGQLDLAMIYGTGFPPFLGGVLRYADELGIKDVYRDLSYLSKIAGENYVPANILAKMAETGETFYDAPLPGSRHC